MILLLCAANGPNGHYKCVQQEPSVEELRAGGRCVP